MSSIDEASKQRDKVEETIRALDVLLHLQDISYHSEKEMDETRVLIDYWQEVSNDLDEEDKI